MLADDLLTHSRYVSRYHEFFYGLSAKGTGVFYLPKAHGQLVPVVCLLSGDEVPSPTLLKTVLHKLGVASFQLATAGPCLLAYGSAEWRSADDIQDWLYQRANPPLVDRQAALIELLMQPEGRWILERMISDKFEPYKALIDQVLFEAWSPPSTSGEGATFPKLGSSGD
jgi:hypothetical protein